MDGLKYGEHQVGGIRSGMLRMDMSARQYLEMGVTGPIVWTLAFYMTQHMEKRKKPCLPKLWMRENQIFGSHQIVFFSEWLQALRVAGDTNLSS
jgi:hypothetical protein